MSSRAESFPVGLVGDVVMPPHTPPMHEREGDAQGLRYLYRRVELTGLGLPGQSVGEFLTAALDARFGLDPAFLDSLRELNLLYDRDADGEFLHFYTATVGSVFFEVVERRGSYDGYGAPNAPVRHAVQYDHLYQPNLTH